MTKLKGICKNIDGCDKAERGEIQEIERTSKFECEECHKPLQEVKDKSGKKKGLPPLVFVIIGVVLLAGIGAGTYLFLSGDKGKTPATVTITPENPIVQVGETVKLMAKVDPEDKRINWKWRSNDEGVATVNETGLVTGVTEGNVNIIVADEKDKVLDSITVTVEKEKVQPPQDIPVESVSLNQSALTLKMSQNENLIATVNPDNATNKSLEWSSSDTSIVTVDENGKVTAIAKNGKAKIIVKAMDGSNVSDSCDVSITTSIPPAGNIDLGYGTYTGDMKNGKANGTGRLVFKLRHTISVADPQNRMAEPGDYLDGQFENNNFYSGKWFGRDGAQKGAIILQKSGVPSK